MPVYAFEGMTLDTNVFELRRDGRVVAMEPQTFDVLVHLVRNRDRVVSKEELMDEVWGGRFVSETAVTSRIKQARRALGDDGVAQRLIKTMHGRGYRFVVDVVEPDHSPAGLEGTAAAAADAEPRAASAIRRGPVRYTTTDGLHIAYQVSGRHLDAADLGADEKAIDVVLVAGYISHLELDWEDPRHVEFLAGLGALGRLVRFDKRGTGMSDRPQGLPDLETRMHDVLAVMDVVGSRRALLVGYSEGGPMATLFAASHPERVSGLVLYGSYAKRIRGADYPWAQTEEDRAEYTRALVAKWDWEADMLRRCPSADRAMQEWWARRARASTTPGTLQSLMDMNSLVDIRDILDAVRVPTMVMHRLGDRLIRIENGRYLADNIPGALLVELEGADHFVAGDPEQLVHTIVRYVQGLPPGSPEPPMALAAVAAVSGDDATEMADRLARLGGWWRRPAGDVHLLTFDGPATAIRAVREASQTGASVGVHVAEIPRNRGRITGPAVDRAVELSRSASPGAVWVSPLVRDLLSGSGIDVDPVEPGDGHSETVYAVAEVTRSSA